MDRKSENLPGKRAFFRWRPSAWLKISGADAAAFLQGQFTNDLRGLAAGAGKYGLWLNHKGRVLADSFVGAGMVAGEFWVGSYHSVAQVIRDRLESFVIADDVIVDDQTAGWQAVTLFGESDDLGLPEGSVSFAGRRGGRTAREVVWPVQIAWPEPFGDGTWIEWTEGEVERRRIEAGIPAVPRDIGPGELPNEGGLEVDAISYSKGCYLGQEVMARLKTMGQVRRRLRRVRGEGAVPSMPAAVFQAGRQVGELRSAVAEGKGFVGLALLSTLHVDDAQPLAWTAEGAPALRVEASR